eukprot:gnl/Trimastix_PCT/3026.p1 GENE.gnl/Trimastix_PCT/3026~~gnl/Trimastix_PCT/3026.p1  ORF type:complete len:538 (-),score=45.58 gnl/Trimastix_PCT/3026:227-1840(-)
MTGESNCRTDAETLLVQQALTRHSMRAFSIFGVVLFLLIALNPVDATPTHRWFPAGHFELHFHNLSTEGKPFHVHLALDPSVRGLLAVADQGKIMNAQYFGWHETSHAWKLQQEWTEILNRTSTYQKLTLHGQTLAVISDGEVLIYKAKVLKHESNTTFEWNLDDRFPLAPQHSASWEGETLVFRGLEAKIFVRNLNCLPKLPEYVIPPLPAKQPNETCWTHQVSLPVVGGSECAPDPDDVVYGAQHLFVACGAKTPSNPNHHHTKTPRTARTGRQGESGDLGTDSEHKNSTFVSVWRRADSGRWFFQSWLAPDSSILRTNGALSQWGGRQVAAMFYDTASPHTPAHTSSLLIFERALQDHTWSQVAQLRPPDDHIRKTSTNHVTDEQVSQRPFVPNAILSGDGIVIALANDRLYFWEKRSPTKLSIKVVEERKKASWFYLGYYEFHDPLNKDPFLHLDSASLSADMVAVSARSHDSKRAYVYFVQNLYPKDQGPVMLFGLILCASVASILLLSTAVLAYLLNKKSKQATPPYETLE